MHYNFTHDNCVYVCVTVTVAACSHVQLVSIMTYYRLTSCHAPGSGVATPGPTRAQALIKFVCALVKLLNSWAKNMILATTTAPK